MGESRIERLRNKLLRQGKPSVVPPPFPAPSGEPQPSASVLYGRLRPIAEAMYLVMTADSHVGEQERDALRGALRLLTEGRLSSAALEAMLAEFRHGLERDGREVRLDSIASELYGDRDDVELALMLVAAAAVADGRKGDAELETITSLAERLSVPPERLQTLIA